MTLGDKLVLAREMAGLTAAELAKKIGVKAATISRWENDENRPSPRHWKEITHILGKPREWFSPDETGELIKRINKLENEMKNIGTSQRSFDQDELALLRFFDKTKGDIRLRQAILAQIETMIGDDSELGAKKK